MTNIQSRPAERQIQRRTVIKGAAWSVPVIAAAVATPLAAASVTPPPATSAQVTATTDPTVGSNTSFSALGQVYDNGVGDYVDGTLPAGTLFTLTFTNGAKADSYANLVGLTYVSGNPASGGPVVFMVTADTASSVRVRLNNVQPVGGVITATIMGGSGTSTIKAA